VGDVIRLVLRQGVVLAVAGVLIGSAMAIAGGQLLAGFLFAVTPRDPAVLIGAASLLVGVALLASYLPARRAGRIDAAEVMRQS
jgi:putative ABC transport system permease protein